MLQFGYVALSALMTVLLFLIGNYAVKHTTHDVSRRNRSRLLLIVCLLGWHIYNFALGSSGFLADLSFPPRFVIFLIFPAFLFTGVFLFLARKSKWVQVIPAHWLVAYQTFRIGIETLFVYTVAAGLLHKNVTIEGYNFDMIFAFTAPIVALLAYRLKQKSKRLLIFWHSLGLMVIASIIIIFQTTIYAPEIYGPNTKPFPIAFGTYPYNLVAGFLMPSAVFIHVLALVSLIGKKIA